MLDERTSGMKPEETNRRLTRRQMLVAGGTLAFAGAAASPAFAGSGKNCKSVIFVTNNPATQAAANPGRTLELCGNMVLDGDIDDATVTLKFHADTVLRIGDDRLLGCICDLSEGGRFIIKTGTKLTFRRAARPSAPAGSQIFEWDPADYDTPPVAFTGGPAEPVYTSWWGLTEPTTDGTHIIQAAINSVTPGTPVGGGAGGRVVIDRSSGISAIEHNGFLMTIPAGEVGLLVDFGETQVSGIGMSETTGTNLIWLGGSGGMIQFRGCAHAKLENLRLRGNTDKPPAYGIGFIQPSDLPFEGHKGSKFNEVEKVWLGPDGGIAVEFEDGIRSLGANVGNDFMNFRRVTVSGCTEAAVHVDQGNHTHWHLWKCHLRASTAAIRLGPKGTNVTMEEGFIDSCAIAFEWAESLDPSPRSLFVKHSGVEVTEQFAQLRGWADFRCEDSGWIPQGDQVFIAFSAEPFPQKVRINGFYGTSGLGTGKIEIPAAGPRRIYDFQGRYGWLGVVEVDGTQYPIPIHMGWIEQRFVTLPGGGVEPPIQTVY